MSFWPARFTWSLLMAWMVLMLGELGASNPLVADEPGPSTALFNGRDLEGWYVYTTETLYENPGVFQVLEGALFVPGGKGEVSYFGGLITDKEYSNYRLRFEYKWGQPTYGTRKGRARDSGLMLHCTGANGPGPWMTSYEFQIIEGGTGDLLVVNTAPQADPPVTLSFAGEMVLRGDQRYFHPGGESFTFENSGRLNWWGRDPKWEDTVDVRGPRDLEKPHGEWTPCEIIARKDTLEFRVDGKLVNQARGLTVTQGKILIQTEGAEVWYRNLALTPLD